MKSFLHLLSFGLLASSVSAKPIIEDRQTVRFTLTVYARGSGSSALNGQTVEIVNNVLGVYPGRNVQAQVYTVANPNQPGFFSLHTLPIGIVDHVLALQGSDGLYSLVDVVNSPTTDATITGIDTFRFQNGRVLQQIPGNWVAFPSVNGGYDIRYYDGTGIVVQDYIPVSLLYKKINTY